MRYEVSVKSDYVPTWGISDAFREFQSNAQDAATEMGAPAKTWYKDGTVYIQNDDVVLPREVLLFGHTTKYGREGLIGQFGEGLKLACLAAVRAGHEVVIRSGSETWRPAMSPSKVFPGTEVLTFDISTGRAERQRVRVEISGITEDMWAQFQDLFLGLRKLAKAHLVSTASGSLILDPALQGRIYVKGVFVEFDGRFNVGYDIKNAKVDRDRKLVERWSLESTLRSIWFEAASQFGMVQERLLDGIENQMNDMASLDQYSAYEVPVVIAKAAAARFEANHGDKAVPVLTLAESREMEHLGRKGVVVSKSMQALLAKVTGTFEQLCEKLRSEVSKTYSWGDLTETQRSNLERAVAAIDATETRTASLDDVDVVDFRSPGLEGMFKDNRVLIAAKHLENFGSTLLILVHEFAHRAGGDGHQAHIAEIEETWKDLYLGALS